MSTPQNGAAACSQSHVSRIAWFSVAFTAIFVFLSVIGVGPPLLQRLSSDLTVFSQQPASNADSACPACQTLPGYWYLVAAPW